MASYQSIAATTDDDFNPRWDLHPIEGSTKQENTKTPIVLTATAPLMHASAETKQMKCETCKKDAECHSVRIPSWYSLCYPCYIKLSKGEPTSLYYYVNNERCDNLNVHGVGNPSIRCTNRGSAKMILYKWLCDSCDIVPPKVVMTICVPTEKKVVVRHCVPVNPRVDTIDKTLEHLVDGKKVTKCIFTENNKRTVTELRQTWYQAGVRRDETVTIEMTP